MTSPIYKFNRTIIHIDGDSKIKGTSWRERKENRTSGSYLKGLNDGDEKMIIQASLI